MVLVATVVDPLSGPVPDEWDRFVDREGLLALWRSALVRTAAWCARGPSSMVLVQEATGDAPVAIFHARHAAAGRPDRFVRPGEIPAVSVTDCRAVPQVLGPGMAFAADLPEQDRREAVRVFERATRRLAGAGRLAVAYRDLPGPLLALVPARRRFRLRVSANMVLHNEWDDLDGYLRSLPRKWRSQLKTIGRSLTGREGPRVRLDDSVPAAEACWLVEAVRSRNQVRRLSGPPMPARYFQLLAQLDTVRFLTYRDADGRLLAYTGYHDNGTDLVLLCWGSGARADGADRNLYFDQYLRLVNLMISTGRTRMTLGKGLPEIKARYGARPEPLWGLVGLP